MRGLVLAAALTLLPAVGTAQEKPACAATDRTLPAELAAWAAQAPVSAAAGADGLAKAALPPGRAMRVALTPTPQVRYLAAPEKPPAPASHGGVLQLKVDAPGTYVVAVGSAAWVDMLRDGKPLTSAAHSHGPDCSTIRKRVEFPLSAGTYVLQLSGNPDPATVVMVARRR